MRAARDIDGSGRPGPPRSRPAAWIGAGIVVLVLAAYAPVVHHGFVNFDDPEYVVENVHVRRGLTGAGFLWAFRAFHAANWHPLTWLSHMLDCQLFGLDAGLQHGTSVLLHAAAAFLLFVALRRMTSAPWRSGAVAALFALHPLRVESVAWIAERKDVLGAFCWMATLLAYARWTERPTWQRYVVVILAFAAGLLAKPMVVTLPFALLLLDVWPLGRLPLRGARALVLEKVPLLVLAAATSAVVFVAQHASGAIVTFTDEPLRARIANALLSYVAYLGMTIWPHGLAVFYPYRESFPAWQVLGAAVLLAAVTAGAVRRADRAPWLLVGWLWYLGTLVPVIGIVRAGEQAMADRFTYVPQVGLFVAAVWGAAAWTTRWRARRIVLPVVMAVALVACGIVTRLQLRHWRDSLTLFAHALAVTDRNFVAHMNYGFALLEHDRRTEALEHFRATVALKPRYAKARLNLGFGLAALGRPEEAMAEYREAIRLDPDSAAPHYDLGLELAEQGRFEDAIPEYADALRADPSHAKAHNGLGLALARLGRPAEAVPHYEAALALEPDLAATHNNLAVVLEGLGHPDEALAHYRQAVRLAPGDARAHFNLAAVLAGRAQLDEAAAQYRATLRLRPDLAEAHLALGDVLLAQGLGTEALTEYRIALATRPGWVAAESRAAWAIATGPAAGGDVAEAVRFAEHARDESKGKDPEILRNLAAAYAAAGRFPEAIEAGRRAVELARAAGLEPLAVAVERQLDAYGAGRSLRRES